LNITLCQRDGDGAEDNEESANHDARRDSLNIAQE